MFKQNMFLDTEKLCDSFQICNLSFEFLIGKISLLTDDEIHGKFLALYINSNEEVYF